MTTLAALQSLIAQGESETIATTAGIAGRASPPWAACPKSTSRPGGGVVQAKARWLGRAREAC